MLLSQPCSELSFLSVIVSGKSSPFSYGTFLNALSITLGRREGCSGKWHTELIQSLALISNTILSQWCLIRRFLKPFSGELRAGIHRPYLPLPWLSITISGGNFKKNATLSLLSSPRRPGIVRGTPGNSISWLENHWRIPLANAMFPRRVPDRWGCLNPD